MLLRSRLPSPAPNDAHQVGAPGGAHNLHVARIHDLPCPCRAREATAARYVDCCGHWHDRLLHGEDAPTPEALMRSRYSAYALAQGRGVAPRGMLEYLMQTW